MSIETRKALSILPFWVLAQHHNRCIIAGCIGRNACHYVGYMNHLLNKPSKDLDTCLKIEAPIRTGGFTHSQSILLRKLKKAEKLSIQRYIKKRRKKKKNTTKAQAKPPPQKKPKNLPQAPHKKKQNQKPPPKKK